MISSSRLAQPTRAVAVVARLRGSLARALPLPGEASRARLLDRLWWPFEAGTDLPALYARGTNRDFPAYLSDRNTADLAIMVQRVQRRVRAQRLLILAARAMWLSLLVTFVLMLVRFVTVVPWAVIGGAIAIVVGLAVLYHRTHPVTIWTTARLLDRHQGLAEQIATALELALAPSAPRLAARQVVAALARARDLTETHRFRPRVPWAEIQVAFSIALLVAGLSLFGGPAERLVAPASPIMSADTSAADLGELGALDPSATGDLASIYDGASEYPSTGEYLEDFPLGDYNSQELQEAAARSAQSAEELRQIAEALKDASITNQAAQEIQAGNYEAAAQEIADLARNIDSLSPEARQDLADRLRQAAQNIQPTDPELASRLEQASKAVASRSDRAAAQGLEDVSNAITESGQNVIPSSQLGQAMQGEDALGPAMEGSGEGAAGEGAPGEGTGAAQGGAPGVLGEGEAGNFGFESADSTLGLGGGGGSGGAGAGSGAGAENAQRSPSTNPNAVPVEVPSDISEGPTEQRPNIAENAEIIKTGPGTTGAGNVPQSNIPITTGLDPNSVPRNLRSVVEGYFRAQN